MLIILVLIMMLLKLMTYWTFTKKWHSVIKIFSLLKSVYKSIFIGFAFLSTLTSVNSLSCISMNNQQCKVRPNIVNVTSDESMFNPFSINTSKCGGSWNNINAPYTKMCVLDVVKNLNVNVFNLMSRTNEARLIEWHEICECKCRLDAVK